jgi:hypothetical protein
VIKGKEAYLRKLTTHTNMRSVQVGRELDGSTPPSVFIGSWNYPRVYAGPMIVPEHGDTSIVDSPESWIPEKKTQEDIVGFRMSLVRGKRFQPVTDLSGRFVEKLQDIALSDGSIYSEAVFDREPRGRNLSDEHTPFGPSAELERFDIGNVRWDQQLEKVYYDDHLRAAEAVAELHDRDVPFSSIQKARLLSGA